MALPRQFRAFHCDDATRVGHRLRFHRGVLGIDQSRVAANQRRIIEDLDLEGLALLGLGFDVILHRFPQIGQRHREQWVV